MLVYLFQKLGEGGGFLFYFFINQDVGLSRMRSEQVSEYSVCTVEGLHVFTNFLFQGFLQSLYFSPA